MYNLIGLGAKLPILSLSIKIFAPFLILLFTNISYSQVVDHFSDNDFTLNPPWAGDNSKFTIDNFKLRLQAPAATSTAYLSTTNNAINSGVWEFTLRLEFNPSSSNYVRVYLVSDQADLLGSLNGYFVLIGDPQDEISLYRQSGSSIIKIVDGPDGRVNLSIVDLAVKVTRDDQGNWELFSDVGVTGNFNSEGTAVDNTFKASTYFGIVCTYTSTRSDKFYFDDLVVTGNPYVDVDPPVLTSIEVLSSQEIALHFNESIDPVNATNPLLYALGSGTTHPSAVIFQPDEQSIKLSFNEPFPNGVMQSLTVSGLKDPVGNILSTSSTFLYFQPMPVKMKDVIFTEIFADPSPQINLPDAEYVEVYNRSLNPINTLGWQLSDGNSIATLPYKIILPNEYWVITSSPNVFKFGMSTPVLGVSNFPTLNNSNDTLTLKTPNGITIDSLNYNLSWYRDIDKQEGGWSLELIDPNNPCAEEENWAASESEQGGTPGEVNSVFANKPDLIGPKLSNVTVLSTIQLLLSFNEKLESPISHSPTFSFLPAIEVTNYHFESKSLRSIVLNLSSPLVTKQLYTITIKNLYDCSENIIQTTFDHLDFALPEEAEAGDVVINEILFNPRPNGVDFVEVYNRSSKYINLKNWIISNYEGESISNPITISTQNMMIRPQQYLVLTSDPIILKNNYPQGVENTFISTKLPSFPDDEGSVALVTAESNLIDYFLYQKSLHSELIKDEEGVSLERISLDGITNDKANWNSASSVAGFATPGYVNSNSRPDNIPFDEDVIIDPQIFTPNSGSFDFSTINFHFAQTGFIANVKVFDYQGRLIKTLANNETLGHDGFFRWDGDLEDGAKARAGYYFVWFEVFNMDGLVKTFRRRVIVVNR